jgi:hypothetical protein
MEDTIKYEVLDEDSAVLNAINGVYPSARVSGRQCPTYNGTKVSPTFTPGSFIHQWINNDPG